MELSEMKRISKKSYISFITEYKTTMYRIAFGYLSEEAKALDAVDEAVYLGYLHRKELRDPNFLKTWLTRILINECYRILRRNKREVTMEEPPEKADFFTAEAALPLKQAVQDLPEDLRKVIVLRYFGGYTIADTAKLLELPEGTVSTRSRKALGILRVALDEEEGGLANGK
ncbi:sigma-70 family RNA polymerase sigma factor [Clostridiales bacterium BAD-6]|uniref:Sigma-70 family RNA polymerase sigma factor n=2 Tax=Sinanaerobacter chloroacetimidivorans TaxID=2818044 RepID=A0A8J8B3E3_9FIRM|nr:sigma-70 family RNA polymerase sigma factor [Sinanaerobacter chloroacetimidivorans]